MKLSEIHDLWEIDSKIDKTRLDDESLGVNSLMQKYLKIFTAERILYKNAILNKKILVIKLEDYYTGKIDGKDIGREPFALQLTKTAADKRVETDPKYIQLEKFLIEQETKILALKDIIDTIRYRGNNIRSAVDFIRWQAGFD